MAVCPFGLRQRLAKAKRDELRQILKQMLKYEVLLIDDIGYVQQSREEVLFTLLAERYERGTQ